jgi:hypothetical protein
MIAFTVCRRMIGGWERIMVWMVELVVLFALFTLAVVPKVVRNPLSMVHAYPPDIRRKAMELGLATASPETIPAKRAFAVVLIGVVFGFVVHVVNGADRFLTGAGYTYILWAAANWYDALVIDCLWFCHSKKAVIPGTEGMAGYKDYRFHIVGGLKGMLLGIPAALVAGVMVELIA